jgi:energy-coupling factor transporter ATP-binding protein EcfA2
MYANINALRRDVGRRLRRGEHMVLYGGHGSGKSTLLVDLETRLSKAGVACAHAATTHNLDDITRALEQAFPAVNTLDVPQRTAQPRAWKSADLQGGVLLLDHLTDVSNVMVRFLRRLRGGVIGVLTAVDTEVEEERRRMKPWRLGALSMRMPPLPGALLRQLLQARCAELHVPMPGPDVEQRLLRAANGRPGWILQCVELQARGHYRQGEQIFVAELSDDTENALRHLALGTTPSDDVFS